MVDSRWVVALLLTCVSLVGCSERVEEFGGPTMGSRYSVKYLRGSDGPALAEAQAATEAILAEVDQQLSTYRSDSLISRFNALPAHSCQPMPESLLALVRFGEQLSLQSAGAFDLTLEPLLNLWGFGPQSRGEQVPSAEQLAEFDTVAKQVMDGEALELGLVNAVFDSHEATVAAALQCAREIAAKPPVAIWGTKQALHYARDHSVEDSLRQMGWLQGAIWSNAHVRESITAMKEKRAGSFTPLSALQSFKALG